MLCQSYLQLTIDVSIFLSDPCMLSCRKGRKGTPRGRVKDGTRCNVDPMIKDVCIEGICKVKKNIFKRGHKAQSKAEKRHAGRGARDREKKAR